MTSKSTEDYGNWHQVEIRCKEDLYPIVEVYREHSRMGVNEFFAERGLPPVEYPDWMGLPDDEKRVWVYGFLRAIKSLSVWGVVYPGEPEPTGEPDADAGAADAAIGRAGDGRVYRRRGRR